MSDNLNKLKKLTDDLLNDLLEATDEEIVMEAIEEDVNVDKAVASVRSLIEQNKYKIAQKKIKSQKSGFLRQKGKIINIVEARRKIIKTLEQNPFYENSLTMAARSGENMPDEDILGCYEDMVELGLIEESQDSDDK